jgi:hypothetical protein
MGIYFTDFSGSVRTHAAHLIRNAIMDCMHSIAWLERFYSFEKIEDARQIADAGVAAELLRDASPKEDDDKKACLINE